MGIFNALRNALGKKTDPVTLKLYKACVDSSRRQAFYLNYNVPDTVDGRFDLLLLHVTLVILRLNENIQSGQNLFDMMFTDMERSLREMGVGDMSIGKKMKPMLAGFYGRAGTYKRALAEKNDELLSAAIARNVYGTTTAEAPYASRIARYARETVAMLALLEDEDVINANFKFPGLV